MNSLGLLTIVFYKTQEDYDKDRPAAIYIITPRRNQKLAIDRARIVESRYKHVQVKILIEHKHKQEIENIINKCLEAPKTVSPSVW
jgi:predicted metal-dependent TIM-barrel fold hydrolase